MVGCWTRARDGCILPTLIPHISAASTADITINNSIIPPTPTDIAALIPLRLLIQITFKSRHLVSTELLSAAKTRQSAWYIGYY
jgi:hypothetical protein